MRNYKRSYEGKSASLRKSLEQIPNISESDIQKVIDDVTKEDPFLEAQRQLTSEYKRTQFIKEKFSFVAPQEILLNPKQVKDEETPKAVVHYVSIVESFKALVQDPFF